MNKETKKPRIAIVGPGSIGLDLMYKIKKITNLKLHSLLEGIRIAKG
ncbi:Acetaldehyde dehydrogenase [Xenorhabdus miraniensis]|uniref:Acetaldehyde dehydrogenase n=1 Tax=Xenorhabdus miraniensis TaxID=351674 RepID=A0A2D0JJT1_9GAMM|nr:Acetaldehyde dehydrogenase [Xenorhabdus miraniensis]